MNGAQKLFVGGVLTTAVVWAIVAHTRRPVRAQARVPDLGTSPAYAPAATSWGPYEDEAAWEDDAAWQTPPSPQTPEEPDVPQEEPQAEEESQVQTKAHGLSLAGEKLELMDWNAWMETAPTLLRATLSEGTRDPEQLVANLFRRLFPESAWPPPEDSPLLGTWNKMVATVGRSLERPFKPHLEIVS